MINPVLSNINLKIEYFFVPTRLLWDKWSDFITGGEDGNQNPTPPIMFPDRFKNDASTVLTEFFKTPGSLFDYMGIGYQSGNMSGGTGDQSFSALPFLAYNKIINEYYRDENLQTLKRFDRVENNNWTTKSQLLADYMPYHRAYSKDYFTSALPFAQRGPSIELPFDFSKVSITHKPIAGGTSIVDINGNEVSGPQSLQIGTDMLNTHGLHAKSSSGLLTPAYISGYNNFSVKGLPTGPTINEVRRSFAIQRFLEASARGGSRLIEAIAAHFGVKSSDARLQRPEFLYATTVPVMISQVLQQSQTTSGADGSPLGSMAGHGVAALSSKSFRYYCEEHGFIIGLVTAMPQSFYFQGSHRMFYRRDKFDYAWPELARLGEQPVYRYELFNSNANLTKTNGDYPIFGYTPRYSEYKFMNNSLHGAFRTSLFNYTTARNLASPLLNESFILCYSDDVNHIFSVEDDSYDHFWMQIQNIVHVKRCLPYYGTPSVI